MVDLAVQQEGEEKTKAYSKTLAMIYYTHPTSDPDKIKEELEWLDEFIEGSKSALSTLKGSPDYDRKKEFISRLEIVWAEVALMVKDLNSLRLLIEELRNCTNFESVQKVVGENVWTSESDPINKRIKFEDGEDVDFG